MGLASATYQFAGGPTEGFPLANSAYKNLQPIRCTPRSNSNWSREARWPATFARSDDMKIGVCARLHKSKAGFDER